MDDILARLTAMQATLDAQQATIAQQQADIVALRQENVRWQHTLAPDALQPTPESSEIPEAHDEAPEAAGEADAQPRRGGLTSRRSLLRGAAAATAAASVGAVALGATQPAHAAPQANGSNLILGAYNSASSQTTLDDTSGNQEFVLEVWNKTTNTNPVNSAIYGVAPYGATGITGQAATGYGVFGYTSNGGTAVYGEAAGGWAIVGDSSNTYDIVAAHTGFIGVQVQGSVGAPTTGFFFIGDCIRDANGDLWLCTAGDGTTLGTWVKAAHAVAGMSGGAITYLSKPLRLLDTRPNQPAVNHPGSPYLAGSTHTITVSGASNGTVTVPAGCVGAIGNLTVIGQTGGGNYVELVPSGVGFQGTSNLNFTAGQLVANSYNVGLNASGALDIILGSGGNADVILDLYAIIA
jgi:anti-sigma-K factor RskA